MFILATKRRLSRNSIFKSFNFTNENTTSSPNQLRIFDISYEHNTIKDVSTLTKTQIKVIITVVIIISFIILVIAIFRFKNTCRNQETDNLQTDIIRNRASQFSEPSSRRGSVGYYTQKYNRTPNIRFDNQLNISLPAKRLSIPACDHSSKLTAVVALSLSPVDTTVTTTDATHHHHVTSSCDTSNIPNKQVSITSTSTVDIKPVTNKSDSPTIDISQCDDQTPLLTSELASTIKDSLNHTTRKYSLNALLPLVRPSISHPLCSSLTSTNAVGINTNNGNGVALKPSRRVSLSSVLHRNSLTKQSYTSSDSSERNSLLKTKQRKKSSTITPIDSTPLSSYQKVFMQKIERFRFIDDSASSTTTVTSPVESLERVNNHETCTQLITSAIEQFDDYIRTKYNDNDDDVNSLIDQLNSDILINGSYSDLNILNNNSTTKTVFKPVNEKSLQAPTSLSICQQNEYRQTIPINIPHSVTSLPLSKQRNQIDTNGHSHSMDFKALTNKRDLIRPTTLISTINQISSSSSSTTTLTSIRSSTSLEFDDNTKPSGVLVDDDFISMSSPIDEHFWDMTIKNYYELNNNECFPNVGSSPDVEIKPFDIQQLNRLSETSCDDDDDDDDDSTSSITQPETFSIHDYKLKELEKPLVLTKPISQMQNVSEKVVSDKSSSSNPSINSTEQLNINNNPPLISFDQPNDASLLQKFSLPINSGFVCQTLSSSQQHSEIVSEEDDTQESSTNDASEGDESADNGEIDLVQEFELSKKEEQIKPNNLWTTNDRDICLVQEDDLFSELITTQTITNRTQPTSIMKITNIKPTDNIDDQQQKPKVRFNLDPQYEREREWNKVNKLLRNSVEWTDEFEV